MDVVREASKLEVFKSSCAFRFWVSKSEKCRNSRSWQFARDVQMRDSMNHEVREFLNRNPAVAQDAFLAVNELMLLWQDQVLPYRHQE